MKNLGLLLLNFTVFILNIFGAFFAKSVGNAGTMTMHLVIATLLALQIFIRRDFLFARKTDK